MNIYSPINFNLRKMRSKINANRGSKFLTGQPPGGFAYELKNRIIIQQHTLFPYMTASVPSAYLVSLFLCLGKARYMNNYSKNHAFHSTHSRSNFHRAYKSASTRRPISLLSIPLCTPKIFWQWAHIRWAHIRHCFHYFPHALRC